MSATEMARREEALGYPSSDTRGMSRSNPIDFSLPYINLPPIHEMRLPRPSVYHDHESDCDSSAQDSAKEKGAGTSQSWSPVPWTVVDKGKRREDRPVHQNGNSRQLVPSPSPIQPLSPVVLQPKAEAPLQPFSTWVPDDSLHYINPRLLSDAEKRTLERRRGSGEDPPITDQPTPTRASPQPGPSSATPTHDDEEKKSCSKSEEVRPPSPAPPKSSRPAPPPTRPSLGPRARTTDYELLRQVKSNNLSLPSSAPSIPTFQTPQTRPALNAAPVVNHRPLPFTHTPLVHPRLPNQRPLGVPVKYNERRKVVHPPPPTQRAYPSVLEPDPRADYHLMPEFWARPPIARVRSPSPEVLFVQRRDPSEARSSATARHQR